eukprot:6204916-Pleurochrysis_carterae.AAC.2
MSLSCMHVAIGEPIGVVKNGRTLLHVAAASVTMLYMFELRVLVLGRRLVAACAGTDSGYSRVSQTTLYAISCTSALV